MDAVVLVARIIAVDIATIKRVAKCADVAIRKKKKINFSLVYRRKIPTSLDALANETELGQAL